MDENGLELTFALKHLDQHLQTNDANVKKLLKLQQRIISKENQISCKGAVKIYQAYEGLLDDIEKNVATIDHILRFCGPIEAVEVDEPMEPIEPVEAVQPAHSRASYDMKQASDFVGKLVAALTLTTDGTEEWILARVCAIKKEEQEQEHEEREWLFEVEDAEIEGEPEEKESHLVKKDNIIPVPGSDDAALEETEFKLRQSVLALYPGTTCFYSAVVMSTPSRRRKTRDYLLKFADDDVPSRQCSPRFVLPFVKSSNQ